MADRPVEDVVRLITLLESSPEYALTTVDALRVAGVDRSVEDVTRLVTLLTKPPRETDCADEAIRAAAERRPVEDVIRLMQLLHRTPVEPHCGQAAVQAAAVNRPVEEIAELIGRLAENQTGTEGVPLEATSAGPTGSTGPADPLSESARAEPEAPPAPERRPTEARTARIAVPPSGTAKDGTAKSPAGSGWSSVTAVRVARGAAALVFLCGLAHAPRHWAGLSQGVLGATAVAAGLCMLSALAMTARSVPARLVAATAALGVTASLAAGQVLGGRFGLPDPFRLPGATLAPPWLAGTAAATAVLATLTVLLATLVAGPPRHGGAR
ncbi:MULTISPECIES: hypothetical protein [Streptomyces]|uniref:hypothetical protein n=1 Tax=Streptomyces TaxID=1883 RepID=UPI001F04E237|nr:MULTISPECIES: hypothetical protein [Streptomyces]